MNDELGAHVSSAGGVQNSPERAARLASRVLQMFTKMANRWADPVIAPETAELFKQKRAEHKIEFAAAHDSYLINLATADSMLFERSYTSFVAELQRCALLGLDAVVSHPGHATDGNVQRGIEQNARAVQRALDAVPSETMVLFESTAGGGNALGARFEQLAELMHLVARTHAERIGVCIDTCHLWAAGYDLRGGYTQVMLELEATVRIANVRMVHLNDSIGGLGSRRDRHAHIGAGLLGSGPFGELLNDPRFAGVPKVIETPKDEDVVAADLRNLATLRSLRTCK
jgi:deoxyribonuclease IV